MKRNILTTIAISLTVAAGIASTETANRMTLHFKSGETQVFNLEELDHMEFDHVDVAPPTPKVGDYFYSDGTWSDGGLISMDANGCNAVWSDTKPAPIAGKTVVGIICNTNPDRMAAADKEAGFTHGYVIGCKNITDPKKSNYAQYPETVWFAGQYAVTDGNKVSKLAKSCYENLSGREETKVMWQKNDARYYDDDIPMFYNGSEYNGTCRYPVQAPEGTSGWFIPSIGQIWDCVANFCNGDVAQFLAENQAKSVDFTYYVSEELTTTVPFDDFMKVFSLVPAADKDEMVIPEGSASKPYISLGCSTRYDAESRVIINLGMNGYGLIEGMAEWFDGEVHARPFFAF